MKKAVLLVRVSTQVQDYEAQTNDLVNYAHSMGFKKLHIIQDKESAVKLSEEERNGLNAMKEFLTANQDCKTVFIWEISRLARTEKVLHSIKEWLVSRGIQLHVFDKRISLLQRDGSEDPNTALIFSILGSFASQEAKQIKARFNRGKARNKELGKYNGGPIKFGYMVDENGYIVVDEEKAEIVKTIFKLYATGQYSVGKLTVELQSRGIDIYHRAVQAIICDNSYTGEGNLKYEPIVSKELFNLVAEVRARNNAMFSKVKTIDRIALARKIMKCEHCGHHYTVTYAKSGASYVCAYAGHRYEGNATKQQRCKNSTYFNRDWLDALLWYIAKPMHEHMIAQITMDEALRLNEEIKTLVLKKDVIAQKILRQKEQKDRAVSAWVDGLWSEEKKDKKLAQIKAQEIEMIAQQKHLDEQIERLEKLQRVGLGYEDTPLRITKDYRLEDMDAIVKECITNITLGRHGEKYYKVVITLITGEQSTYYFKKNARVGGKWHNADMEALDEYILNVTHDFWELRKKEMESV